MISVDKSGKFKIEYENDRKASIVNNILYKDKNKESFSKSYNLREKLECNKKNATMLSIIQDNPCLHKCIYDLKNNKYEDNFDSYYKGCHDWIKKKIIDAILDKFGEKITLDAEQNLNNGSLDIIIYIPIIDETKNILTKKLLLLKLKAVNQ